MASNHKRQEMSPLARFISSNQANQIVVDTSNQRISSDFLSSDQCDSLGKSTERVLIGSLLTPEEDIGNGEISQEYEIQDAPSDLKIRPKDSTFQDSLIQRVEPTILEEVAEIQSAEAISQSVRSNSAKRSILSKDPSCGGLEMNHDEFIQNQVTFKEEIASVVNAGRSEMNEESLTRMENLQIQNKQRSSSMTETSKSMPKKQNFVAAAVAAFRNRRQPKASIIQQQKVQEPKLDVGQPAIQTARPSRFLPFFRKKLPQQQVQNRSQALNNQKNDPQQQNEELKGDAAQQQNLRVKTFGPQQELGNQISFENSNCSFQFGEEEDQVTTTKPNIQQTPFTLKSETQNSQYLPTNQKQNSKVVQNTTFQPSKNQPQNEKIHQLDQQSVLQVQKRLLNNTTTVQICNSLFQPRTSQNKNSSVSLSQEECKSSPVDLNKKPSLISSQQSHQMTGETSNPFAPVETSSIASQLGDYAKLKQIQIPQPFGVMYQPQRFLSQIYQQQQPLMINYNPQSAQSMFYLNGAGSNQSTSNQELNPFQVITRTSLPIDNNKALQIGMQDGHKSHVDYLTPNTNSGRFSHAGTTQLSSQANPFVPSGYIQQTTQHRKSHNLQQTKSFLSVEQTSRHSNPFGQSSEAQVKRSSHTDSSFGSTKPTSTYLVEQLKQKLEEKPNEINLGSALGIASDCCREQALSRWIQTKLVGGVDPVIEQFYQEVAKDETVIFEQKLASSKSLLRDVFGNYVIQKMLETDQKSNLQLILSIILLQVNALAIDQFGCRVLQKAIDTMPPPFHLKIVSHLPQISQRLMFDTNGNHVIQRCIQKVEKQQIAFLIDQCVGKVTELSCNVNGCRVIQRILERFKASEIGFVFEEMIKNLRELRTDVYGNYVVSHVMEFGEVQDRVKITDEILDDIVELSMHKYGSNVVEKCLQHSLQDHKEQLIDRLVSVPIAHQQITLVDMLQSKYANFVIQKAFQMATEDRREILLSKIEQVLKSGKINPRKAPVKHVFNFLETNFKIKFDMGTYEVETKPPQSKPVKQNIKKGSKQ